MSEPDPPPPGPFDDQEDEKLVSTGFFPSAMGLQRMTNDTTHNKHKDNDSGSDVDEPEAEIVNYSAFTARSLTYVSSMRGIQLVRMQKIQFPYTMLPRRLKPPRANWKRRSPMAMPNHQLNLPLLLKISWLKGSLATASLKAVPM
jgi:hypothetical protein